MSTNQAVAGAPWRDIAASAYRAYSASTGNKNFRGEPMPEFNDLPQPIRTAWEAAVRQAVQVSNGGSYGLDIEQSWAGWQSPDCPTEELIEPNYIAYPLAWRRWYQRVNDCGKVEAEAALDAKGTRL